MVSEDIHFKPNLLHTLSTQLGSNSNLQRGINDGFNSLYREVHIHETVSSCQVTRIVLFNGGAQAIKPLPLKLRNMRMIKCTHSC